MSEDIEAQESSSHDADVEAILAAYRAKQMREHMIGPAISFVVHVLVLGMLAVFATSTTEYEEPAIEITVEEIEIVELEEEMIEEIEEIEEETFDDVAPEISVEAPTPTETEADVALEDVSDEAPQTDDNSEFEEQLDVQPTMSPLKLSSLYGGRSAAGRAATVRRHGGSGAGQDAVLRALRWLQKVQKNDGSWPGDPAFTALALLCFLAHGDTPLSEEFGVTVQKAMQWLAERMPSNGKSFPGGRGAYSHGIITYALAEAYGMTQIPFLKRAMEDGLDVLIKGQQRGGGYDYGFKKGERWDLSVAGWQMQAMKAGYVAGASNKGLHEAIEKSIKFTKSTYKNYKFGYSSPGAGRNMTGVGAVCLQLLGDKKAKEISGALDNTIMKSRLEGYEHAKKDFKEAAAHSLYGWYYDTQAAFNEGGSAWKKWRKVFEPVLINNQHEEGYWDVEIHKKTGVEGKVFSTTLCCLQLEVYYRYLPSFDLAKMGATSRKVSSLLDDDDDDDLDLLID